MIVLSSPSTTAAMMIAALNINDSKTGVASIRTRTQDEHWLCYHALPVHVGTVERSAERGNHCQISLSLGPTRERTCTQDAHELVQSRHSVLCWSPVVNSHKSKDKSEPKLEPGPGVGNPHSPPSSTRPKETSKTHLMRYQSPLWTDMHCPPTGGLGYSHT